MTETRFLVFTDLHTDMIHDAVARMEIIADAAKREQADFVIQLGDLQYPDEAFLREQSPESLRLMEKKRPWSLGRDDEKKAIMTLLKAIGRPVYSVLGNHDLHICDKSTMCRYLGMPAPFYSFREGHLRFLVLDTNWICTKDGYLDLSFGNNQGVGEERLRYLPPDQLSWLEETIESSDEPCVLLSHASLVDPLSGIHEKEKLMKILRKYSHGKIILAMNGHGHIDGLTIEEGIPFWDVNSASYHYTGENYTAVRYSEKICKAYPRMPETAPYYNPLYAVVRICDTEIEIHGRQSSFVGPSPQELGMKDEENDYPPCAEIRDRRIRIKPDVTQ